MAPVCLHVCVLIEDLNLITLLKENFPIIYYHSEYILKTDFVHLLFEVKKEYFEKLHSSLVVVS